MVDHRGYIKLFDMHTATNIEQKKLKTIIGSPYYTAPEMIEGNGYNHFISLFSLGVLLYEFMCGDVPFGEKSEDPIEIYE